MRVQGFTTGVFQSNCYLIVDPAGADAVIVDPGQDSHASLTKAAQEAGVQVGAVLLTHGHIDHVWNASEVSESLQVPCFLHPEDRYMLADPGRAVGADVPASSWDLTVPSNLEDLQDGQRFSFGTTVLETRHTPGHTPGHCIFVTDGLVVSGDLIFAGSVGRTDFPGGSFEQLIESINREILPLDDSTSIVSGHGPATTVGQERASNPFLSGGSGGTSRGL